MKMKINNSLIGIFFVAFAAYKSVTGDEILEPVLYSSVGIGFILMDAVKKERFADPHHRLVAGGRTIIRNY